MKNRKPCSRCKRNRTSRYFSHSPIVCNSCFKFTKFKETDDNCIYIIRCTVNGKMYVGSTWELKPRIKQHLDCLRAKTHHNVDLQNDFNKHGIDAFAVLTITNNDIQKETREYQMLYLLKDTGLLYNKNHGLFKPQKYLDIREAVVFLQ